MASVMERLVAQTMGKAAKLGEVEKMEQVILMVVGMEVVS